MSQEYNPSKKLYKSQNILGHGFSIILNNYSFNLKCYKKILQNNFYHIADFLPFLHVRLFSHMFVCSYIKIDKTSWTCSNCLVWFMRLYLSTGNTSNHLHRRGSQLRVQYVILLCIIAICPPPLKRLSLQNFPNLIKTFFPPSVADNSEYMINYTYCMSRK